MNCGCPVLLEEPTFFFFWGKIIQGQTFCHTAQVMHCVGPFWKKNNKEKSISLSHSLTQIGLKEVTWSTRPSRFLLQTEGLHGGGTERERGLLRASVKSTLCLTVSYYGKGSVLSIQNLISCEGTSHHEWKLLVFYSMSAFMGKSL